MEDLPKIRETHKDKKIVCCSGSFDLVHVGHILFFEDCKKHGDILVTLVGSDEMIKFNKGPQRPILNQHIRLKTIDSLKPVDYCSLDIVSTRDNPLLLLDILFEKLKPDVYIVNDDAFDMEYRERITQRLGIKLVVLPRFCPPEFDAVSTSKIIETIKKI